MAGWSKLAWILCIAMTVAAATAMAMPVINTAVTYSAWGLSYDGGGFTPGFDVGYDTPPFDDGKGQILRLVGPLLVASAVFGALGAAGAFLPGRGQRIAPAVLGLCSAGVGVAALVAAWLGSRFADGANSLADLAVGGWALAAAALVALIGIPVALLVQLAPPQPQSPVEESA